INGDTTEAYIKKYDMKEGASHEDDEAFKSGMLKYMLHEKAHADPDHEHEEDPEGSKLAYQTANQKADDLKTLLETKDADIAKILKDNAAIAIKNTSTEKQPAVPDAVEDKIDSTVKKGDILTVTGTDVAYVIYVDDVVAKKVDFSYVTLKNDLFFDVVNDLTASLNKVYPTEKMQNYKPEAEKDSFEEWASAHNEGTLEFTRLVNDVKSFESTKDEVTTYNVYMVTKAMALDETIVYQGGYLLNNGEGYAEKAETNKTALQGKTYAELITALANLGGTTSQSAGIK
ncbi:MAG: hypothetical protein IIX91_03455, partial [Clostridia bacterium]|nr:hypothetical protein [Clostridia bacterium]